MKFKLNVVASVVFCAFALSACSNPSVSSTAPVGTSSAQQSGEKLQALNWDKFNKSQLDNMMAQYGKSSPNYNPAHPPYVVFDWDNTSIFLDIEEAILSYQLKNLVFGATPKQLDEAIRKNISDKSFGKEFNNAAGQAVDINKIAPDIIESYTWLYNNYKGLKGTKSLEEVQKNPHYSAFTSKLRYLYEAIGGTFDHATSYPWVTYLFAGMTEAQVRDVTQKTVAWQVDQPVNHVTWTTPTDLSGKAGVVSVTWNNGLRIVPEMRDLYQTLRANGFDIWVCSASFVDVIKEFSSNPNYGYNNPDTRVIAMELERDKDGKIMVEFRKGYDQTQGKGKTKNIERFLVSKYGYGPIFVAGDSEGDQNMIADFPDTKIGLIINRLRSPSSDIGKYSAEAVKTYGQSDAKFLLQGRNDNTGLFVPSQKSYKFGSTVAKDLR